MTENQAAPIQGTVPLSTSLDQGAAVVGTGGGAPNLTDKTADKAPPKPEAPGDTLRGELARIRDEEAKDAEKVKAQGEDAAKAAKAKADEASKAEKPEAADKGSKADEAKAEEKGKPAEKGADGEKSAEQAEPRVANKPAAEREEDKPRPSEGQKRADPPARFLPKAKEAWINVPHSVRDEVRRMEVEHEAEITKYRAATERYEPIRQFDEIAKSNGRELKDSLAKVVQVENALARNPIMGLDMILREIGPRKADGSPLTLYEVAQHIARQSPQEYQQAMQGAQGQHQQAQERQQTQSEVQELRNVIQSMQVERTAEKIIEPFKASHPRYPELEDDIAFFLKSGKIPASLSPVEKLEAAYDMAARINPVGSRSASAPPVDDASVAAKPAPADDAGAKSVRGAPSGGSDPDEDDGDVTDIRKLLQREARKLAS